MPDKNEYAPVSVIIPCYNHGQYIREAIASVELCDKSLFEIIIVNDGSTDPGTIKVLAELKAEGYQVIDQENQGPAKSRNTGIEVAHGRYILPVDADNRIRPQYLTLGLEILDKEPEVAVVYGRAEVFGQTSIRNLPEVRSFDLADLVLGNYIDNCAVIRKSAIEECGGYDTEMLARGWEDWDLWLSLAAKGWKFHFEDRPLFAYRILETSVVSSISKPDVRQKATEYICRKHAMLLRRVILQQYEVLSNYPEALRYARMRHESGIPRVMVEVISDTLGKLRSKVRSKNAKEQPK